VRWVVVCACAQATGRSAAQIRMVGGSRLLKRPNPRRNQGFRPLLLPNARRLQFDFQFPGSATAA
jgi:hypothetical protein